MFLTSAEDYRELKQTDTAAGNLQISIQKDSRPSEFSRPLTAITLNLNRDLPVDRRRVSLLKLPYVKLSCCSSVCYCGEFSGTYPEIY